MPGKKVKRSFLFKVIVLLTMGAAVLLLISHAASFINPAVFWPASLIALAYPILLLVNLLFVLYWLLVKSRALFISLLAVLVSFDNLQTQIQLNLFQTEVPAKSEKVRVLSFNARLFDLYEWTGNPKTRDKIFKVLQEELPDIICFQEFYTSSKPNRNNLDTLVQLQRANNHHVAYTETLRGTDHWGIATFSKYPILKKGNILFNEETNNLCIYSDLKIGQDTVRVYNVHFQSNRFKREDYEFLGNPNAQPTRDDKIAASRNIIRRLQVGAVKRARQVEVVARHIQGSPYPVIVCGDFNDPPASFTYNKISKGLEDAFVESGWGLGNTFNGLFSILRIDYLLHDPRLVGTGYRAIRQNLSDHYPIVTDLWLKQRSAPAEID
ncbi:endonuclease/exonuclease/phosphatase family protein [Rufibacter quisquiliarum]|uniref:Endonuclease/exonuclease/phosphatase family metal-dependent hydrolase n=1 Tax=Rufibacter quisquiliarum TaxID=1549639 RepID=A0A839GN43_9BACT|nr:endonuclease/exonuclease/phosphatase family metal-dependent hydrolase [Rufibacter quisquiliarum]